MKVLLTGASSFTGMWFAKVLREAGHNVVVTLRSELSAYTDGRGARVESIKDTGVTVVDKCSFGDERFLALLQEGFDVICHHGAQVTNYKSLDFDVSGAVKDNTRNARAVFETAIQSGVKAFIATGSVFEQDEGLGASPRRAFSPYGLSKGLSWQVFRYWGAVSDLPTHKFVIPNPFGPYEEPRFCAYLLGKWSKGEVAQVGTPNYTRDNIHVSLLAAAYHDFVARAVAGIAEEHCAPSGYIESQGAFARRFAAEIGGRLGLKADLSLADQKEFIEPAIRVNSLHLDRQQLGWDETRAWDELAAYYKRMYLEG
ncbi:NAD-dependent epimerase/dehydratase family protein [Paraburkholderia tropica]|uniref:NAD-dependent epimerase/dehydratase family protein n=1 Tax=Paraburkholderia tropica TaxID=92647 RepID=UPI003D28F84C